MQWWPKNVIRWCHSKKLVFPINDSRIRSSAAALIRSQRIYARLNDDDRSQKLSDLERIRLRESMTQNAYDILFGRSNDMLAGNAGKRMKAEDDGDVLDPAKRNKPETSSSSSSSSRQPPNVNPGPLKIDRNEVGSSKTRESVFPEFSCKPSVTRPVHPSISSLLGARDLRDVPLGAETKNTDTTSAGYERSEGEQVRGQGTNKAAYYGDPEPRPSGLDQEQGRGQESQLHSKGNLSPESGFLMDSHPSNQATTQSEESDWRQTALDRREFGGTRYSQAREPSITSDYLSQSSSASRTILPDQASEQPIEPTDATLDGFRLRQYKNAEISRGTSSVDWPEPEWDVNGYDQNKHSTSGFKAKTLHNVEKKVPPIWLPKNDPGTFTTEKIEGDLQLENYPVSETHGPEFTREMTDSEIQYGNMSGNWSSSKLRDTGRERSTSDVLGQFPKDDIDMLTASNIRASMDARIRALTYAQEQIKPRDELEKEFTKSHEHEHLEPLIEPKVVNDQKIQRIERQLLDTQKEKLTNVGATSEQKEKLTNVEATSEQKEKLTNAEATSEATPQYSLENLAKLLQLGGDTLAKTFWSDPIESSQQKAEKDLELHLKQICSALEAGRAAMNQVTPELSEDLPALKPLLIRVDNYRNALLISVRRKLNPPRVFDELDRGLYRIRMRSIQLVEELQNSAMKNLETTEKEALAYKAKQSISYASKIVHKELKLTRTLMINHQKHLQKSSVNDSQDVLIWNIGYTLQSLHDAMVALQTILTHAMYKFGIKPTLTNSSSTTSRPVEPVSTSTKTVTNQGSFSNLFQNFAADQQLKSEVEAQKAAMQGLSDDGYNHPPSLAVNSSFEDKKPLMNSLFRPFGSQLGKLGNDSENKLADASFLTSLDQQPSQDKRGTQVNRNAPVEQIGSVVIDPNQADTDAGTELEAQTNVDNVSADSLTAAHLGSNIGDKATNTDSDLVVTETQAPTPLVCEALEQEVEQTAQALASMTTNSSATTEQQSHSTPPFPTTPEPSPSNPATQVTYTTLTYDPSSEAMYITRSTSASPASSSPTIPLPTALAALSHPHKFLPHLPSHFVITLAKPHLLTFCQSASLDQVPETVTTRVPSETEVRDEEWSRINPVDGTTRLSPTGFVGVDDFREDIRRDMEDRRRETRSEERESGAKKGKDRERRRGGVAAVFRTAIVAGAVCYVVGVGGEIAKEGNRFV